jgi:hypothetical protein
MFGYASGLSPSSPGRTAVRDATAVLPEIEAAVAVRGGPSASIFPMVYYDLIRWIEELSFSYRGASPSRYS